MLEHDTSRRMSFCGAPKNVSVAHGRCATEFSPQKYYFCGAPCRVPQKVENSVAHFQNAPQKYCSCATENISPCADKFDNNLSVAHFLSTSQNTVRHKIICHAPLNYLLNYRLFAVLSIICCINLTIIHVYYSIYTENNRNSNIF